MSISFGNRGIADIRMIAPPRGVPGIGFSRLQFPLEIHMDGLPAPAVVLEQLIANVYAGSPGASLRPLGKAVPQNSWFAWTIEHRRSETIVLELDLAGEQLEALERLRAGGPIVFQFDLSLHVSRPVQRQPGGEILRVDVQPGSERLQLLVNISDWAQVLNQLGYLDFLIVAVELPIEAPDPLREAVKLMRVAHSDLIAGRYNAAVGSCRLAMESVGPLVLSESSQNRVSKAFAESEDSRRAMTTADRAELVRMAVRHFCNPAHHVGENGAPEVFSRQDALFILTATAGVIWEAIAQLRTRP